MKKHPQANALYSRLVEASNTPLTAVPFTGPPAAESDVVPQTEPESPTAPLTALEESKPRRRRKARADAALEDDSDDTVPISLRPHRKLLTRYVNAAADRMRETGRTISAQQIMLEVLERGL